MCDGNGVRLIFQPIYENSQFDINYYIIYCNFGKIQATHGLQSCRKISFNLFVIPTTKTKLDELSFSPITRTKSNSSFRTPRRDYKNLLRIRESNFSPFWAHYKQKNLYSYAVITPSCVFFSTKLRISRIRLKGGKIFSRKFKAKTEAYKRYLPNFNRISVACWLVFNTG